MSFSGINFVHFDMKSFCIKNVTTKMFAIKNVTLKKLVIKNLATKMFAIKIGQFENKKFGHKHFQQGIRSRQTR